MASTGAAVNGTSHRVILPRPCNTKSYTNDPDLISNEPESVNGRVKATSRRPRRVCQGTACGGKTNLHHNDPHDMCFRCRGAYHDLTECPLCQLVPASTRSTWVTRCQYWRMNMDPEGPPPHSKPNEIENKKKRLENLVLEAEGQRFGAGEEEEEEIVANKDTDAVPGEFNPVITSYGSAAGMFGVPYSGDAKESQGNTPGTLSDCAPPHSLTPDNPTPILVAPTQEDGLQKAGCRQAQLSPCVMWTNSAGKPERSLDAGHCLPLPQTIWNEPRACVDNASYYSLMNQIMKTSPDLIEQGGHISQIPKMKYMAITGPKPHPSAFPLDDTLQTLIEEKQNTFLSSKKTNKMLSTIRSRFKVVDGHMTKFGKPKENAILHLLSKEGQMEEGQVKEGQVKECQVKERQVKDCVLVNNLRGVTETQYASAQTGISLANHLLILSQYGLAKLRQVDLEDVAETLKAIQKASEDLLSTSIATWDSALLTQRHIAMTTMKCSQEAKNELLVSPISKDGWLFSANIDRVVKKHSDATIPCSNHSDWKRQCQSDVTGVNVGKKSRLDGLLAEKQRAMNLCLSDVGSANKDSASNGSGDRDVIDMILADNDQGEQIS